MSLKSFFKDLFSQNKNYIRKQDIHKSMKDLPIGIQDFKKIREKDYLYVDKTKHLYKILEQGEVYFLSRPRRFGKSITISTLEHLFKGEKELFRGTYIYDKHNFEEHPVINLSMSSLETKNVSRIRKTLLANLKDICKDYNLSVDSDSPKILLKRMIKELAENNKKVVILIDEYDKPIIDNIEKEDLEEIREELRSFYSILKDMDPYLRFVFITGISKFSRVSIFSGLNNLKDLTLKSDMSDMLGYSQEDIRKSFPKRIKLAQKKLGLTKEEFWKKLQEQYNGYSWNGKDFVYNPYSILNFFDEYSFENYWYESGTPTFLTKYMDKIDVKREELEIEVDKDFFSAYPIERAPAQSFLFQAGYLTIKEDVGDGYRIGFPNKEVQTSFNRFFLEAKYELTIQKSRPIRKSLQKAFEKNDAEGIIEEFKKTYSAIPHQKHVKKEGFYDSIAYTLLLSAGIDTRGEESTSRGDSDIVLEKEDRVFIFEFKNDRPEVGIEQIKEKGYAEKYDKKKFFVGIELDFDKRNIVDYKVES